MKSLPQNVSVLVMFDNKTTVPAINKTGSNSPDIHAVATSLFKLIWKKSQHIITQHIPGPQNVVADQLSSVEPVETE